MPSSGVYSNKDTQVQRVNQDTDLPRSTWIYVLDFSYFFK
jgi:hypothetical protein